MYDSPQNRREIIAPQELRIERRAKEQSQIFYRTSQAPDVLDWWTVIRDRRRIVFASFCLVLGIVLAGTLHQKPIYLAKSLIEIDRENPGVLTAQDLFQFEEVSDAYLETQYKVLGSDDLAERVIRQLDLSQEAEFRPSARSWPWTDPMLPRGSGLTRVAAPLSREVQLQEMVLQKFQSQLEIRPIRRSRAVEIRFVSQDPVLAARVVNAVAENYIEKNLEARWESVQRTSEWLSQQLGDLKTNLERSEEVLQKYAAQNGLLYLASEKGNSESVLNQSVRELQQELTRAQADRIEKESVFQLLQSGDYGSLPGVVDNRLLQDLTVRLADLQREHAQVSATFTDQYPKVREVQSQIDEIQTALDRERWRAAQKISNDYFAALRREKLVEQAFAQREAQANQVAEKSVQYGILSREVDTNQGLYNGLLQRLKEAGVSAGLKASNIRIVDSGRVAYKPISPNYALNLGLAAVLGSGLGVGLALLREHFDQTIRGIDDVEVFLGVPMLGFVPAAEFPRPMKNGRVADTTPTPMIGDSESNTEALFSRSERRIRTARDLVEAPAFSESFRDLRTSVVLSVQGRRANSFLVTSALPGEGKTTIAVNLAISLAQLGQPVLLIDADMRHPGIQNYFQQDGSRLSAYLEGQGSWQKMVYPASIGRLSVLNCGPAPESSSELLSSERMRALLRESITMYRFVVLDSPPLLKGADSRILGSMAGATILVVKGGDTPRQVIQFATLQARGVGANILGVVVNQLGPSLNGRSYPTYPRWNEAVRAAQASTYHASSLGL